MLLSASLLGPLVFGLLPAALASVQDPSLSPTPPMGFNNWARFMCALNESVFTETADAMASNGLLAAGYNRINLDDCWLEHERAPNGSLVWNSTLFPHGLIWLGDYLHQRGFHFGIYEDAGNLTCGGYPGSKGYEEIDAADFAAWGVDYVKIDGCNLLNNSDPRPPIEQFTDLYAKWHDALTKLDQPFVFSESAPAYFSPDFQTPVHNNNSDWYAIMDFARKHGELARHSNDVKVYGIDGVWEPGGHWESIMTNYGYNTLLARYQRCGFYNDPDFLEPGFPDLTIHEKRSHFALWASFSAPLIISSWIPELPEEDVEYLTNRRIIAVDQDPLCLQATLVSQDGFWDVLTKDLANGDRLLTVLNRGNNTNSTSIPLARVGLKDDATYTTRNLWTGQYSTIKKSVPLKEVPSHATEIFRISPRSSVGKGVQSTPTGMIFNTYSLNCLTGSRSSVNFAACSGGDSQVWRYLPQGLVSPLSSPHLCLTASKGALSLEKCGGDRRGQKWAYGISGNLVSGSSGQCLTESGSGKTTLEKCGFVADNQVFALPSGTKIVEAHF